MAESKYIYIRPLPTITSTWENEKDNKGNIVFKEAPSIEEYHVSLNYALPSGITILAAQIWITIDSVPTGYSILTVNGNPFAETYGNEIGANVRLNNMAGTLDLVFTFKANGSKRAVGNFSSALKFKEAYLWVSYWGGGGAVAKAEDVTNKVFVPPQSVALYVLNRGAANDGAVYIFDGVVSVQHEASLKVEEDPDSKKIDEYVNNAKNEPDKVVLDVVMSDVYTDPDWSWTSYISKSMKLSEKQQEAWGYTTRTPWSRSANAYRNFHYLKTSRSPICVVTPHFVYTEMLLTGISVVQDENNPNGWAGQLTFETITATTKKSSSGKTTTNTSVAAPSPSWLAQHGISL